MPVRGSVTSISVSPEIKQELGLLIIAWAGHDNFTSWDQAITWLMDKIYSINPNLKKPSS